MPDNGHKQIESIEDLQLDSRNPNRGTERGSYMLDHSLESYGAGRSILADKHGTVIAGNKTLQAAVEKGFPVKVVETDGKELVVVQRKDLDLNADPKARQLAYADNRSSEVGLDWDTDVMLEDIGSGLDLEPLFKAEELEALGVIEADSKSGESEKQDSGGGRSEITCPSCGHEFRLGA